MVEVWCAPSRWEVSCTPGGVVKVGSSHLTPDQATWRLCTRDGAKGTCVACKRFSVLAGERSVGTLASPPLAGERSVGAGVEWSGVGTLASPPVTFKNVDLCKIVSRSRMWVSSWLKIAVPPGDGGRKVKRVPSSEARCSRSPKYCNCVGLMLVRMPIWG